MGSKLKGSFFVMNYYRFLTVFFILALVGCGDGGGDGVDLKIGTLTLESTLQRDTQLPQWETTTIKARALRVDDGTDVMFTTTGGRIENGKMQNGEVTVTFYALDSGGEVTITATTRDTLGNLLEESLSLRIEEDPFAIRLNSSLPIGAELSQGGETTITASLFGSDGIPVADGTEVRFTATSGIVSASVPTVSGIAIATFNAASSGGLVTITATSADASADITIRVGSGPATSVALVSITPDRIGLRGTGLNETATLTYNVKDGGGNPVSDGQRVNFNLSSPTGGGEFLSTSSAITVGGAVSVTLTSGTVAGVATVTASTNNGTSTVSTETRVTMGNGRPDQLHLGIAFEKFNVPGLVLFGVENQVTAYIADRFSNPIPAGNPVYFASACGTMALTDPDGVSTNLTNAFGQATATSITANPRASDGLCQMLIWTEGEEAWVDSNGNGVYDNGEPHAGIGEPYIDANSNGIFDADTETYFDLDGNGRYTAADTVWNADTFVWTAGEVRWSGQTAPASFSPQNFALNFGESQTLDFTVADINGNPLPAGTEVSVSNSCAGDTTLLGETSFSIPDAVYAGPGTTDFSVTLISDWDATDENLNCTISVGISAGVNGSTTASVTGTLLASPIDLTPSAGADNITINQGNVPITAYIFVNDTLGDEPTTVTRGFVVGLGTPINIGTAFVSTSGNSMTLNSDGTINYFPTFTGTDVINYTITDANGDTGSANVTITVEGEEEVPVAPEPPIE